MIVNPNILLRGMRLHPYGMQNSTRRDDAEVTALPACQLKAAHALAFQLSHRILEPVHKGTKLLPPSPGRLESKEQAHVANPQFLLLSPAIQHNALHLRCCT